MDATTKQKTLTGVLVTILVGSVFAMAAPTASAAHLSAGSTDATVDVLLIHEEIFNGTSLGTDIANVTLPADGKLRYNVTYDLTFTNILTSGFNAYGYAGTPGDLRLRMPGGFILPNSRPLSADLAHIGKFNVTFPAQQLNSTGVWNVIDPAGGVVSKFFVSPLDDLTVTLSQNSFTYSEAAVSFQVTVGPLASGQSATLFDTARLTSATGIPNGTIVTGTSGLYVFFGPLAQSGSFNINATHNEVAGGSPDLPEHIGTAQYTINPATVNVTPVATSVKSGFTGTASWNITYPTGLPVFANNGVGGMNNSLLWYNLTAVGPGNFGTLFANSTSSLPTLWYKNDSILVSDAAAPYNFTGSGPSPLWSYNGYGNFTFQPNSTWPAGTWTFSLTINKAGLNAPEYSTSWTFGPATPADINVDVLNGLDSSTLANLSVLEAITSQNGPPGSYTLFVDVTGNTQIEHPTALATTAGRSVIDNFLATSNVSITGDVILLTGGTRTYDPATGRATMGGVVPTKVGGSVIISVTWKGTTTTVTLPIVKGADLTASTRELVVDTTTTVTFTLRDAFGNPVPDGKVFLFKNPSGDATSDLAGATSVNGTGAPGAGQNGQYSLTLKPGVVGKYIAYAIIGRLEGASDHRNYSYFALDVVPAHDTTVTVTPTNAMASVTTPYSLNATIPDGRSLGTSAQIWLLTEKQRADQLANKSLTTGATPPTLCGAGVMPATFSCVGVNPAVNAAGGVTTYFFNATLQPGTYWVYICGNAGGGTLAAACTDARHDNNQSLPSITVRKFNATFTPSLIADNPLIQENTTVNVSVRDADGNPWNGTLAVSSADSTGLFGFTNASGNTLPSLTVTNGQATFLATGVKVGDVAWTFDPAGSSTAPLSSLTSDNFEIVGPNVVVVPNRIPVGRPTTLTITVKALNGSALQDKGIRLCGSPIGGTSESPATILANTTGCTGSGATTNAQGIATLGVSPSSTGTLYLYVNDTKSSTTVPVFAGFEITWDPTSPTANQTIRVTVKQVGAAGGEPGVSVSITRNGTAVTGFPQTTGSDGVVVLSNAAAGTYTVNATKTGFDNATAIIVVGPSTTPPITTPKFELSNLQAPATATVGAPVSVSADVKNVGTVDGSAVLLLLVNNQVRGTQTVPVNAGQTQAVGFEFTPTQAGSFKVTVKLATGETLAEKTITVSTPTTTGPTPTTSPPTTSTPVTSTPATSPSPRVPGFEVVALIGAIAVALLVLSRRQK